MNDWRNIPVGLADIGSKLTTVRIRNTLKRLGYSSMGEVVDAWHRGSFKEALSKLDFPNFGKKSMSELMAWISTHTHPAHKPCPFCGNTDLADEEAVFFSENMAAIECGRCSARGPLGEDGPAAEEMAWAAWDNRG